MGDGCVLGMHPIQGKAGGQILVSSNGGNWLRRLSGSSV